MAQAFLSRKAREHRYKKLEYVEFISGSYILTSILPNNMTTRMKLYDPSYVNDKHYFGTTGNNYPYHFTTWSNKYYWGYGSVEGNSGSVAWTSGLHTVDFNFGDTSAIILDGTELASGRAFTTTTSPLTIGSRSGSHNFVGYVYYYQLIDKATGDFVLDLVPVIDTQQSKVGMYNRVNGTVYYSNVNNKQFIAGPLIGGGFE